MCARSRASLTFGKCGKSCAAHVWQILSRLCTKAPEKTRAEAARRPGVQHRRNTRSRTFGGAGRSLGTRSFMQRRLFVSALSF